MVTRSGARRIGALTLAVALVLPACGSDDDSSSADTAPSTTESTMESTVEPGAPEATMAAADLRLALNRLLQEHVFLAGAAVNEAFQGNTAGFDAAAAALDENSVELADAVGTALGDEAGQEFLDLWRSHIDLFVAYATALADDDQATADQQAEFLTGYATDFANFLAEPTGIDPAVLEELVLEHITTLTEAIDTLDAGSANPFLVLRAAGAHMAMIAQPLAASLAAT